LTPPSLRSVNQDVFLDLSDTHPSVTFAGAWHIVYYRSVLQNFSINDFIDPSLYSLPLQNTFAVKKGVSKKLQVSVTLYMKATGNLKRSSTH